MLGRREQIGWTFETKPQSWNEGFLRKRCEPVEVMLVDVDVPGRWTSSCACWLGMTSLLSGFLGKACLASHSAHPLFHIISTVFFFVCLFFCSRLVFVFPQLRSGSACLLGDYPPTAGTESICRAPNLLRCEILKNKCWLNLQRASDKRGEEEEKPLGVC